MKSRLKLIVMFSAVVLIIVAVSLYFIKGGSQITNQSKYLTATATNGTLAVTVTASGNIFAQTLQNANFTVGGKISEIDIKAGDTVTAGQQLAKLDTTQLQYQVTSAQVSLDEAENNLSKAENTWQPTSYTLDNLQQALTQAQLKVTTDQANLNATSLVSPGSEIVSAINGSVGSNVTSSASPAFMTLTDQNGANPINLNFSISGQISNINVQVGNSVSAGQVLAQLSNTSEENQLTLDESQETIAQNNLNNASVSGKPTNYDISNLQDSITVAKNSLAVAQTNLSDAVLKSNINGIVLSVNNNIGDNVSGSGGSSTTSTTTPTGTVVIYDPNSLEANMDIDEADITKVNIGQDVQISLNALSSNTYVGKVQSISSNPISASNVVYYPIVVSLDKIDPMIKPGMSTNATVFIQSKDNVTYVPNSAIKTQADGSFAVQVLNQNGTVTTVPVTVGLANDTDSEILTGIQPGQNVITSIITSGSSTNATASGAGGGRVVTRLGGL